MVKRLANLTILFCVYRRTENSRIHFNEVCATQEVNESSLCLDLHPSVIITGTTVTFHRGVLIIVLPTPSALHRLMIRLNNYSVKTAFSDL